jgi:hypothetical protein
MITKSGALAATFSKLETAAGEVEEIAKEILAEVKGQKARTLELFNKMVTEAYETNGWSQRVGRPPDNATEKSAPDVVKFYVSIARAAYRLNLPIMEFETMGALRLAIRGKRVNLVHSGERAPELKGISLSPENKLIGALWHDVVVVWEHLPIQAQIEFETQVRKLLSRFTKQAPPELQKTA